MKYLTVLFIFSNVLFFPGVAFAVDIYVDPNVTPGNGTGTMADPYGTIDHAIQAVGDNSVVYLFPGAYTSTHISSDGHLDIDADVTTSFTIESVSGDPCDTLIITTHTTCGIKFDSTNNNVSDVTFKNLTIQTSTSASFIDLTNAENSVVFESCILKQNKSGSRFLWTYSDAAQEREPSFVNCTMMVGDMPQTITFQNGALFKISGGTLTYTCTTDGASVFDFNHDIVAIEISNCEFECETNCIDLNGIDSVRRIIITNNTLTMTTASETTLNYAIRIPDTDVGGIKGTIRITGNILKYTNLSGGTFRGIMI